MARNEKNEQGKTKNGLQYYIFPKKDFGEKMAAIVVKRGSNHLFWKGKKGEEKEQLFLLLDMKTNQLRKVL